MKKILLAFFLAICARPALADHAVTLYDLGGVKYVQIMSSNAVAGTYRMIMPSTGGAVGQVLAINTVNGATMTFSFSTPAGGGGASTLAIGTGTAGSFTTLITSPTAVISALGAQFNLTTNGTTSFWQLNGSSVTLLGPSPPAASIAAGSLGPAVIASSFTPSGVSAGQFTNATVTVNPQGIVTALSSGVASSGGGYAMQPATVTIQAAQGILMSTGAISSLGPGNLKLAAGTSTFYVAPISMSSETTGAFISSINVSAALTVTANGTNNTAVTIGANSSSTTLQGNNFTLNGAVYGLGSGLAVTGSGSNGTFLRSSGAAPLFDVVHASDVGAGSLGASVLASSFPATGVVAGTYGDASHVSSFTVNAQGDVSGAANVSIAISTSNLTATGATTSNFLRGDNTWATPPGGGGASSLAVGTGTGSNFTTNVTSPAAVIYFEGSQHHVLALGTSAYVVIDTMSPTGLMVISSMTNYMTQSSATANFLTKSSASITYLPIVSTTTLLWNTPTLQATATGYPDFLYVGTSGTVLGPFLFVSTGSTGNGVKITANGTYGTTLGTSGGFLVDCTGGGGASGMCAQFYTNAGTQTATGGVLNAVANNLLWNEPVVYIKDASPSAQSTLRMDSGFPTFTLVDTTQTTPAGKFQFSDHGDTWRFESRNAADNSFEDIFELSRATSTGRMFIGNAYSVAKSTVDIKGNLTIGTNLAGVTAAPSEGLLVQGGVTLQNFSPGVFKVSAGSSVTYTDTVRSTEVAPGSEGQFLRTSAGVTTWDTIKSTDIPAITGFGPPIAVGTGAASNFTNIVTSPTFAVAFNGNLFRSIAQGTTNMVNIDTVDSNGLLMISSAAATYITLSSAAATYLQTVLGVSAPIAVGTGTASNYTNNVTSPTSVFAFNGNLFRVTTNGTTTFINIDTVDATGMLMVSSANATFLTISSAALTYLPLISTSTLLWNTNSLQANSTGYPAFLYNGSSATLNLLTVLSTWYAPGSTTVINGLAMGWPNASAAATNVLTSDGATPIQHLTWAAIPNAAGVNVATQTIASSTNSGTTELAVATVTITPTSVSAKIAAFAIVGLMKDGGATARTATLTIRRGTSPSASGNVIFSTGIPNVSPAVAGSTWSVTSAGIDTPNSIAAQTYTATVKVDAGVSSTTVVTFMVWQLAGGGIGDAVLAATQTFSGINTFVSSAIFSNALTVFIGTATSNPVNLVISTRATLAAPQEGQIWTDGDAGTVKSFTQGITGSFPRTLFASTGTYILTNATTISTINAVNVGGSGFGTQTLPAGYFQPGLTVETFGIGIASTTGNPTLTANLLLGTTSMANTTARTMGTTLANVPFKFDLFMTCQSTGATGTFLTNGEIDVSSAAVPSGWENLYVATTTAVTLNTTVSNAVNMTFQWGSASVSDTLKIMQYWIRTW